MIRRRNRSILVLHGPVRASVLRARATSFNANDWWNYIKSYHPNMCHQCDFYGDMPFFSGNDLRITFPYLEIVDENTIAVHVHNHCTCELQRVFRSLEP